MKNIFINAIKQKKKIEITFDSDSKGIITRVCIPFDYGPSRRKLYSNVEKYHMCDLSSPDGAHVLSILPRQLISIKILEELFDPADFVTWEPNWFILRDWGEYS